MSKFTDNLWQDIVREHSATLVHAERPKPARKRARLRRPRVLAGSTLGLASIGAALTLILGGTAATAPAFAVTTSNNGSVLVQLNYDADQNLPEVNAKLASIGTGEQISIYMAPGAATVTGPVTCMPHAGAAGPVVKVLVGGDGTEVIAPGESAGNTAEGSFHMVSCATYAAWNNSAGNSGTAG
jgi:hypothetical protein